MAATVTVRLLSSPSEALREALITRDGKRIYRIDDGIPVLLPEEGLEAASIDGLAA